MVPRTAAFRHWRFFLLEKLILPVAMPVLCLVVRTWRLRPPDSATLEQVFREPRLVFATFHGMLLHLLGFWRLPAAYGRRVIVMLSPSLDGRLLAAALAHFGVDHVYATTASHSVAGSVEFIRRIRAGDIGIIAADGPRGPCCRAKPGFLQIAAAANAQVILATSSSGPGIRFGSWDRAHLPLPFARVQSSLQVLPAPAAAGDKHALAAAQAALLESARTMRSPVLPPALRQSSARAHQKGSSAP